MLDLNVSRWRKTTAISEDSLIICYHRHLNNISLLRNDHRQHKPAPIKEAGQIDRKQRVQGFSEWLLSLTHLLGRLHLIRVDGM